MPVPETGGLTSSAGPDLNTEAHARTLTPTGVRIGLDLGGTKIEGIALDPAGLVVARRRVPTPELNRFLAKVTAAHPPTSRTQHEVRILYGAQTGTAPPAFVLFTNVATEFHFSYERFLVNQLRKAFGFEGNPVVVKSKSKPLWKDSGRAGRS